MLKNAFLFFIGITLIASSDNALAQQRTALAPAPHWSSLQQYAGTITETKLEQDLQDIYVPDGSWKKWIAITPEEAVIQPYPEAPVSESLHLPLAVSDASCKPVPRYWKRRSELTPVPGKPLAGLKIVIDPGHLGGPWAKMEERWFRLGKSQPVEEGTMTLITAKLLAKRLRAMGADVEMTRYHAGPTTPLRPAQLRAVALAQLAKEKKPCTPHALKEMEEMLFYRVAEIHHRAKWINSTARPDLVICLHFDAEEWGNPKHPKLVDERRLHFLISGDFNESELICEDERYNMLCKLLGRTHHQVVGLSDAMSKAFVAETSLPSFSYHNPTKALPASPSNPYLWNRNLLATRLIKAPVIYSEAYVMNDRETFCRVQLGDYSGYRKVGNRCLPSIYREYATAIAQGVVDYYGK